MRRRVLIWISSDPRTSHRPAEAIRIGAGVAAWKRVEVGLHLSGPAVACLAEWADEFVDEDHFDRYLPILREAGCRVTVEAGSPFLDGLGDARLGFEAISFERLAERAGESFAVMRF